MADIRAALENGHEAMRFMQMAADLEAGGAHGFARMARGWAEEAKAKHREMLAQAAAWREVGNALRRLGYGHGGQ